MNFVHCDRFLSLLLSPHVFCLFFLPPFLKRPPALWWLRSRYCSGFILGWFTTFVGSLPLILPPNLLRCHTLWMSNIHGDLLEGQQGLFGLLENVRNWGETREPNVHLQGTGVRIFIDITQFFFYSCYFTKSFFFLRRFFFFLNYYSVGQESSHSQRENLFSLCSAGPQQLCRHSHTHVAFKVHPFGFEDITEWDQ